MCRRSALVAGILHVVCGGYFLPAGATLMLLVGAARAGGRCTLSNLAVIGYGVRLGRIRTTRSRILNTTPPCDKALHDTLRLFSDYQAMSLELRRSKEIFQLVAFRPFTSGTSVEGNQESDEFLWSMLGRCSMYARAIST